MADEYLVMPEPENPSLSASVSGLDHTGQDIDTRVVHERALTLFLNSQEVVTMMTIGDHPDLLAIG
ncbi:MAG: sulfurtransferase FdhD, partial [Pseudomonadota bacterium]